MNDIIFKTLLLKGEAGNNIASIEKTATSGLVDTYTITLTDGSTTSFEVTNGKSIENIEKTSTVGLVDIYTIYFNDGTTLDISIERLYNIIDVVNEGVSSDGSEDVGTKVNTLIANNAGKTLYFPKGQYLVDTTIELGTNGITMLCDSGAEFYTENGVDYLVKIGSGNPATNLLKTGVFGGTFDGTDVNIACIFVADKCYSAIIENVLIKEVNTCGIKVCNDTTTSSQCYLQNITIIGKLNTVASAVGIILYGTDNYLDIVNVGRCQKGIVFAGSGNICSNIHVWNNPTREMPTDGTELQAFNSIRNNGNNRIVNLHIDNPYIGIMCTANNTMISVTNAVFNYDISMTDIATEENNACMLWYTSNTPSALKSSFDIQNVMVSGLSNSDRGFIRSVVYSAFVPSTDEIIKNNVLRKFEYVGQKELVNGLPIYDELNNVCNIDGDYPIQANYTTGQNSNLYYLLGYLADVDGSGKVIVTSTGGYCEIYIKVASHVLSVTQGKTIRFSHNKSLVFSENTVEFNGRTYFPIYIKYGDSVTDTSPLYIKTCGNNLNGLYFKRYQNILLNPYVSSVSGTVVNLYSHENVVSSTVAISDGTINAGTTKDYTVTFNLPANTLVDSILSIHTDNNHVANEVFSVSSTGAIIRIRNNTDVAQSITQIVLQYGYDLA